MTRGKWVAMAVLLAVAACLASVVPQAWLWLAYRDADVQEVLRIHLDGDVISVGRGGSITISSAGDDSGVTTSGRRRALVKRWSWLPGREIALRDERCWVCLEDLHRFCPGRITFSEVPDDLPCRCPHPTHAQESE